MELMTQLRADQTRIAKALADYAAQWPPYGALKDAMSYSLLSGGKRIRPALTLAVCRLFGGREEDALPFACGLEMVHTYSLIHDDLPCMDDSPLRRGKPSVHAAFGEDMALLAGDALLTLAFEVMLRADNRQAIPAESVLAAAFTLAKRAGYAGMVGGQVVDVEKDGCFMDEDMLYFVHKNKTSALIEAALMTGAVLAGADEKQAAVMEQYGTDIGLAFQIQDDILDVIGDQEKLGKPVHSDEKNEKTTAVSVYGIDVCRQKVKDYTDRGIEALEALDIPGKEHQKFLVELMKSLVGREM